MKYIIGTAVTIIMSMAGYFTAQLGDTNARAEDLGKSLYTQSERITKLETAIPYIQDKVDRIDKNIDLLLKIK